MLIVRCYKDDSGRQILTQHFQHVKTVAFRHLNIEEDQIRFCPSNFRQCFRARTTLADDFDLRVKPQ